MATHASDIQTRRLVLVATTVDHLRTELEHPENLGSVLGVHVPPGWPPGLYDRDAMQFFLEKCSHGGADVLGWYGWYAIERATNGDQSKLVGSGGYFGPPTPDGVIEIGYSVVEQKRRKGYATEIVQGLVTRAFESPLVKQVRAEAHSSNEASISVLRRSGFTAIGPGRDEGYLRFELQGLPSC